MQGFIKKIFSLTFVTLIFFAFSLPVYAKAILDIVPSSTAAITISLKGHSSLNYTVNNNTNSVISELIIDPNYGNTEGQFTFEVTSNSCAGINLALRASCGFTVTMHAKGQAAKIQLMPRVCGYSGAVCSVPNKNNQVSINVSAKKLYSYIVNMAANNISKCPVDDDGSLGACLLLRDATFNSPLALAFNSTNTIAYVANLRGTGGNGSISICPVESNGFFAACTSSPASFQIPDVIVLNPATNLLYISNFTTIGGKYAVSICPLNVDGSLGTCTLSAGPTTGNALNISLNPAGTFAYISVEANPNYYVSICPLNADGTLGSCTQYSANLGGTVFKPQGVSFNAAGTTAYIANYASGGNLNNVYLCPVVKGLFGSCTTSMGNGSFSFILDDIISLFMTSSSNMGYVPNNGNNTVSICPINSDGSLGLCTATNGNSTFNQPTAVFLRRM